MRGRPILIATAVAGFLAVEGFLPPLVLPAHPSGTYKLAPASPNAASAADGWASGAAGRPTATATSRKPAGSSVPGGRRAGSSWAGVLSAAAGGGGTAADRDEKDWQAIFAALSAYREKNGNLRVPSRFIVPEDGAEDDGWPAETRGLRLGIRVASIRSTGRYVKNRQDRVEALEAIGFEWRLRAARMTPADAEASGAASAAAPDAAAAAASSPAEQQVIEGDPAAVSFDALIVALREYITMNGNAAVPPTFVVPDADPWPMSCRSMPLGMCLNQVVTRGAYLNKRLIRQQLAGGAIKAVNGGLRPDQSNLDDETSNVIRAREDTLIDMGFAYKRPSKVEPQSMSKRFERLFNALKMYKELYGTLDVPQHFIIPEEAPWEEEVHGLRLGSRVNAIRSQGTFVKNNPSRREMLTDLGFRWETEAGVRAKTYRSQRAQITEKLGGLAGPGGDTSQWDAWQSRKWAADADGVAGGPEGAMQVAGGKEGMPGMMEGVAGGGGGGGGVSDLYSQFFGEEGDMMDGMMGELDGMMGADGAFGQRPHTFDDVVKALQVWSDEFDGETENLPEDFEVPFESQLRDIEMELEALGRVGSGLASGGEEELEAEAAAAAAMAAMAQSEQASGGGGAGLDSVESLIRSSRDDFAALDGLGSTGDAELDALMLGLGGAGGEGEVAAAGGIGGIGGSVAAAAAEEEAQMEAEVEAAAAAEMAAEAAAAQDAAGLGLGDLGDLGDLEVSGLGGGGGGAALGGAEATKGVQSDPVATAAAAFRRKVAGIAWPPELAGLPLGAFVAQMRRGDVPGRNTPERREKLDAIGFTWGDDGQFLHFDFDKLVRALTGFMKIQADNCVPFDFVVPPAVPWDEAVWGYPLGREVNLARAQAKMLKKEYPNRFRLLTNMEFMFLPPILSEDFEENERLLEDVYATQRTYVDDTNYAEVFYEELLSPTEWVRLRTAFEKGFEWDSDSRLFTLDDMYAVEKAAEEQLLAEEAAAAEAEAAGLGGGGGLDGMDSFDDIDGLASMDLGLDLGMDLGLDDESWGALGLDAPAADANGANGAESGGSGGGGGGEVVPDVLAKQLDDFDVGAQDLEMGMEV